MNRSFIRGLLAAAFLLCVMVQAFAATTYYVSKSTDNGYATGNDTNNGTSISTPFLTIAKGASSCAAGGVDTVIVNPGVAGANIYAENSGANGWFDVGTCGTITGDTSLCGTTVTPTGVPTIQAASAASRVVNYQTRAFAQTLQCFVIDAQSGASRVPLNVNSNTNTYRLLNFINVASGVSVESNISGASSRVYDRITLNSTVASTIAWAWYPSTAMTTVTVQGGAFSNVPTSRNWWFSGTFGTVTFQADVNGTLPTFTGTTGITYPVRFTSSTTTQATIAVACTGTRGCISIDLGTVTNFTVQNSVFTNTTVDEGIRITGVTCTLGQINSNTMTGAVRGLIGATAEGCNLTSTGNVANVTGNGSAPFTWAAGTTFTSTNDQCNFSAGASRICFLGGTNGWATDATNTGASTGSQTLGNLAADTFVDQFWTTLAASSTGRATHLAAIDFYLKKVGSPSGNVTVSIYADSAGNPSGSALATSSAVAASSLTTSIQQFHFTFATPLAVSAATKYHAVVTYGGSIDVANYVVLDENSTTTIGSILTAAVIGGPWVADTTHALRTIVYTGYYGLTMTYNNPIVRFADATDTRELEGVTSGPINGFTVNGLICTNCGYGALAKNTLGNSYIYNSLITASATSATVGFYSKASANVQFWHNTCILKGTVTGYCYQADQDSLSAVNPVQSSNPTFKDNIAVTVSTAWPYSIAAGTTGTVVDYNDVFAAGTQIDKVTGDNWATWQGAGYDTHSIQSDPRLRNEINPASFIDVTPLFGSPVAAAGIAAGSPTTTDVFGHSFQNPPSIGAVQYLLRCIKHSGKTLCN